MATKGPLQTYSLARTQKIHDCFPSFLHMQIYADLVGIILAVIVTSQASHAPHGWPLSQTAPQWTLIWWLYITRRRTCTYNTSTMGRNHGLGWMTVVSKGHSFGPTKRLLDLDTGLRSNQTTGTMKTVCTLLAPSMGTLGMTCHAITALSLLVSQVIQGLFWCY